MLEVSILFIVATTLLELLLSESHFLGLQIENKSFKFKYSLLSVH
jgi:hypothetical protein